MSETTNIQWTDDSVNSVMGCGGCELFPESPRRVMMAVDRSIQQLAPDWTEGKAVDLMTDIIHDQINLIRGQEGFNPDHHLNKLTNTNIWHLRQKLQEVVTHTAGKDAGDAVLEAINGQITCYAAKLHLNKAHAITNPGRGINSGYAGTFEQLKLFSGRVQAMAKKKDLLGTADPYSPWKDGLPRMVFVSDMGDALTLHSRDHLEWLRKEVLDPIQSEQGQRHIWQWLTKRPQNMVKLSRLVGGFPDNLCAMTTLTAPDRQNLKRLDDLKKVDAGSRGLSMEPLWARFPPEQLDLKGIDWMIVGGESGNSNARDFDLAWARELRDYCREQDVACFIKQLGRNPVENGMRLRLKDAHGGDWNEWPEDLRVREFPQAFYDYRIIPGRLTPNRPSPVKRKKQKTLAGSPLTDEQQRRFKELDRIVRKATKSLVDASIAIAEIKRDKLYRAKYSRFEDYCKDVHQLSRQYVNYLIQAGKTHIEMATIVAKFDLTEDQIPKTESQLRVLSRVKDAEKQCEILVEVIEEKGSEYTAADLADKVNTALGNAKEAGEPKPPSAKKRLKAAKINLDELEDLLANYAAVPEVSKLIRALRENLG